MFNLEILCHDRFFLKIEQLRSHRVINIKIKYKKLTIRLATIDLCIKILKALLTEVDADETPIPYEVFVVYET